MKWRPYRNGESKILSPRYSAKNPSAVSSWTSTALRRDHFSSEFMSTEVDRLPFVILLDKQPQRNWQPIPRSRAALPAEGSKLSFRPGQKFGGMETNRPNAPADPSFTP